MVDNIDIPTPVNPLKQLFMEKRTSGDAISLEEVESTDLTEVFWEHMFGKIEDGELIDNTNRGEVISGKSTINLLQLEKYCKKIQELRLRKFWYSEEEIEEHSKENHISFEDAKNERICIWDLVATDEHEFIKKSLKFGKQLVLVTDESSPLLKTGANVFAMDATIVTLKDSHAQEYQHRLSSTPRGGSSFEQTAEIILEVIGKNSK
jgi:hypothetical protein